MDGEDMVCIYAQISQIEVKQKMTQDGRHKDHYRCTDKRRKMLGNISKEDWNFIFENENQNLEKDFRDLIDKYRIKALNKSGMSIIEKTRLHLLCNAIREKNWIAESYIEGRTDRDKHRKRIIYGMAALDEIGMLDDLYQYYGNSEEVKAIFLDKFTQLYKIQWDRIDNSLGKRLIQKITHTLQPKNSR